MQTHITKKQHNMQAQKNKETAQHADTKTKKQHNMQAQITKKEHKMKI
jgi:hypothetical protein